MDVRLAPLRPWDDFFPGTDRFSRPDFKDISKWNNRVVNNLLYYQTNYLALAAAVISLVGSVQLTDLGPAYGLGEDDTVRNQHTASYTLLPAWDIRRFLSPLNMLLGATVVVLVFLGFVWSSHNKDIIRKFKKRFPTLFIICILLASYFVISLFGGVMVFVFGISVPLLLMFIHASLRLRNVKNKMENKMEEIGLKKTPMGIVIEALEQHEEGISKIADFISKVKE